MSLLTLSDVKKFYGRQDVLKGGAFNVNPGERIGLIGANGAGKSTALRIILGIESPDSGEVHRAKGLRLGYLPQDLMTFSGRALLDIVMDTADDIRAIEEELRLVSQDIEDLSSRDAPDRRDLLELTDRQGRLLELFDALGGYTLETEARKILQGLCFSETDFSRPVEEFSGGWIMRAVLARLLLAAPDILLLDEPTNHLDIDSLLWLEGYLKNCPSALILVSHDRVFLNNVVQKIVEVDRGEIITYTGNYDRYVLEKEKRLATEAGNFASQQERIKQVERFIERNRVRKDRAKQVQSRIKMLEKMDKLESPVQTKNLRFSLPPASRSPETLIELSTIEKRYGPNIIYRDLDLAIRRDDRIAFLGANGRGKSTLMKIMAGTSEFQEGTRRVGEGVVISYFAQFQLEQLDPNRTVLEELDSVAGDMSQGRLRTILATFLFRDDDVFKKVAVLSGGEKTRLILAKIMMVGPNLLLLDEPSNHLDIPGREMLEQALRAYTGTICLISHDRRLINAVANKVLIIKDRQVEIFPGNYNDYQEVWAKRVEGDATFAPSPSPFLPAPQASAARTQAKTENRAEREARKKAEAETRRRVNQLRAPLQKKIQTLENRLSELGKRLDQVAAALAAPETYQDPEKTKALNLEYAALKAESEKSANAWEEAALRLEELETDLGAAVPSEK
ncbi:MAG: ABC-F family ATP-binding cassette domain-containing protein [Pseudomonadota bacterium]